MPSTVMSMSSFIKLVPFRVAATHGIPYSRDAIDAWDSTLPVSVTTASALGNKIVHGGAVIMQTKISP